MSGGDDSVLVLTHKSLDDVGNVTETHQFEAVHDDSPLGIDLTAGDDYVGRSVYKWFDTANRRTAVGDYGSGDTATGAGNWEYASVPSRLGLAFPAVRGWIETPPMAK